MDKRYTVTISFHIWAENDIAAMEQCKEMEAQAHKSQDNQTLVELVEETPFASLSRREVFNFEKDSL